MDKSNIMAVWVAHVQRNIEPETIRPEGQEESKHAVNTFNLTCHRALLSKTKGMKKMPQIRWAIVGTGHIANEFAKGMQVVDDAVLSAVVSRSTASGKTFAQKYGCEKIYTDYERMLALEEIDVVYIATPNDCHYTYILPALEKGIPVLCEKPMVDNQRQLDTVIKKAREKKVFLMEGMWTRCFPAVIEARNWIQKGKIGKPLTVHSSFDIKPDIDDWQPWKGGLGHAAGALRDVGIYSLAMAFMVFPEEPQKVYHTMKSNGEVDEAFRMLLDYGDGNAAFVGGAFNQIGNLETQITGEKGRIILGPEFWHPTTATLIYNDGTMEKYMEAYPATGFQFEIMAVQECLRNGETECPRFTLEETRNIGALIEKTRKEWGIFYHSDREDNEAI